MVVTVLVVIASLLAIASGVWVAVGLVIALAKTFDSETDETADAVRAGDPDR